MYVYGQLSVIKDLYIYLMTALDAQQTFMPTKYTVFLSISDLRLKVIGFFVKKN